MLIPVKTHKSEKGYAVKMKPKSILSFIIVAVMLTTSAFIIMGMSQRCTAYAESTISPCNDECIHQLARYGKTEIINFGEFTNTSPVAVRRKAEYSKITYDSIKVSKRCDGLPVTEIIRTYVESMVVLGFDYSRPGSYTYIFIRGNDYAKLEYDRFRDRIIILYKGV